MKNATETIRLIKNFPKEFWVIIIATLLYQAGSMAFVFLLIYLNKHLGFSLAEASFVFVAFSASMLLTGLMGGVVITQLGAALTTLLTMLVNGVLLLIFPYLESYVFIVIFSILWGSSCGLNKPASQTLVSYLSAPGMYKITFSVYRLSLNLGMSIGPAIGGYLASYSFATIFIANGVTNLVGCIALYLGIMHSRWLRYRPALHHKIELSLASLKNNSALSLFLLGMVLVSMVFYQHESTLAVFLNQNLNLSLSFYGWLFTLNTLMIVVFELPLNVAMLEWPHKINFTLGSVLITLGFAGHFYAVTAWQVIWLTVTWTLGEMILFPSATSYIAEIASETQRANYMSLFSTASNLGLLLGPWGGAIAMEKYGATGLWGVCAIWGIISIIIFQCMREPRQH